MDTMLIKYSDLGKAKESQKLHVPGTTQGILH
jgi:hypothetical protein